MHRKYQTENLEGRGSLGRPARLQDQNIEVLIGSVVTQTVRVH
jgi:hypothetical protein